MPGLPGDDGVERPARAFPVFELRHLGLDPGPPREVGHPRVGIDPEHPAADRLELPGRYAGPAAHVEDVGTGTVVGNLTGALTDLFGAVAVAIVALITFRDDLRARLRQAGLGGVPVLTEAAAMIGSYLTADRELGRIATDADVGALAPTLIGAVHLLFAGREGTPPQAEAVRKVVVTVIACAIPG